MRAPDKYVDLMNNRRITVSGECKFIWIHVIVNYFLIFTRV